jgi:hypothetical protein
MRRDRYHAAYELERDWDRALREGQAEERGGGRVNKVEIMQGDVLEYCCDYDGEPFHACLCDPPYHLTSIQKRFGGENAAPAQVGKSGVYRRASAGFMGQQWDGGDIAFRPETWAAFASLLYPGAFLFAFAGTRGYHRMACAMEDAGLILHPLIVWAFGSGFPKATNIAAQLEKSLCYKKKVGSQDKWFYSSDDAPMQEKPPFRHPEAGRWFGSRYGLQALKPSLECIAVAQKPYKGSARDCITNTGAGSLNIEAARIGQNSRTLRETTSANEIGRWPANLLLDEDSAVALDKQSGHLQSGKPVGVRNTVSPTFPHPTGIGYPVTGFGDAGGASRFFFQSDWNAETAELLSEESPLRYIAKAGRTERDAGLEGMPVKRAPRGSSNNLKQWEAGERSFEDLDELSKVFATQARNVHPTVKPLRLTRYLASLLLPPAEYGPRRLFVPFAGVGSECIGATLAGWESVVGVEGQFEYCEIGRARVNFWQGNVGLFDTLTAEEDDATPAQFDMEF